MTHRKLDFSSWIALLALILSVPAIFISTHQWWTQRRLENARENSALFLKACAAEARFKDIQTELELINTDSESIDQLADLKEVVEVATLVTSKIQKLFYASNTGDDAAECVMLSAMVDKLQIIVEERYKRFSSDESKGRNTVKSE